MMDFDTEELILVVNVFIKIVNERFMYFEIDLNVRQSQSSLKL